MRTSNFIVSPILLARYLLIVTSAVLILFGMVSFIRAHAIPPLANLYAMYGTLMIGDAAVMLICGLFINRWQRIFWLAVAIVALNMILTGFGQFGVVDFFFSLVNAIILFYPPGFSQTIPNSMKRSFKSIIPQPLWVFGRDTYDAIRRIPELPAAYFHPWRRESIRRLSELKDIHKGKRAFIIGNGPSLKQTDLGKLRNEITFGLNRIYLAFPEWGFTTTYHCVTNGLVVEQFVDDIQALPIPKFIAWRSHGYFNSSLPITQIPTFVYTTYTGPKFSRDVRGRVWEGATVTNFALQLAFHMGIEKAILIGVDHNFTSKGEANKTVVSQGDDPNHFAANYFGKGVKWQLPDLDTSEIGYALAREGYRQAGREVFDATVGGKLTIFPKVDYNSLFP